MPVERVRVNGAWVDVATAPPANALDTTTNQVVTGAKQFTPGALLMRSADGTATAEPYSDVNPPGSLELTLAGAPVNPVVGEATLYTTDGLSLDMRSSGGVTTRIGPAAGGGGGAPPWGGVLHGGVGNGEPEWEQQWLSIWGNNTVAITPTNVTATIGRLVLYRSPYAITVNRVRWYGLAVAQTTFRMSVYNANTNAQVIAPITVATTATEGWQSAAVSPAVTLAADTPYWVGLSAIATGTTAALRTAVAPGLFPPLPASYPASFSPLKAAPITNRFSWAQVALTGGVFPATLPALARASAWTGTVPYFLFDNATTA